MTHRLNAIFEFESVALVGASDSNNTGMSPYRALETLGFKGRYYPVDPRRSEVHGQPAFPDVRSLPETPDIVVVAIPRSGVAEVIEQSAAQGVKAAVVLSAGFVEQDAEGAALQERISGAARASGMLVVGPNCIGVSSLANGCAATSARLAGLNVGTVGVISGSGGLLNEIMSYGTTRGLGFSHLVSSGNECDVSAADVIDFFVEDPHTEVIVGVLEAVRNPALFVTACERALKAGKPIILVKTGSSELGARSVTTHTGAIAGSDAVCSALFRQTGVLRVSDIDELVDLAVLFSNSISVLRKRRLERAGIIEISGGGKGLISDMAAAAGVELPALSDAGSVRLREGLEEGIYPTNPIDTHGSWGDPTKPTAYPLVLDVFGSEPDVDIVVSRYTTPQSGPIGPLTDRLAEMQTAREAHPDRLFTVVTRTSDRFSSELRDAVRNNGVALLQGYERGLRAIGRLAEYSRALHGPAPAAEDAASAAPWDSTDANAGALDEIDSKALLAESGLPVVETRFAGSAEEAVTEAARLGYPVALKVVAEGVTHKSDIGGVQLGLTDESAVRGAHRLLAAAAAAAGTELKGVAVQPMASPGTEIVLGAHRDPQFGPVVVFGLGGVFVEILHDVALRVAPVDHAAAEKMLDEINASAVIAGARGRPGVDREALCRAITCLSDLMLARPDISSIDVNPVIGYPDGIVAVDARVVL